MRIVTICSIAWFCLISVLSTKAVYADEYPWGIVMRCEFSLNEEGLTPDKKTAQARFTRYLMFKRFMDFHKRVIPETYLGLTKFKASGVGQSTEEDFQADGWPFLTIVDEYKFAYVYPSTSKNLSLDDKKYLYGGILMGLTENFGVMPRYTFIENANEPDVYRMPTANFTLDPTGTPRIISYSFKYPIPASQRTVNTIKKDPEYFVINFQLKSRTKGLTKIPAALEYRDNKGNGDKFVGLCNFRGIEPEGLPADIKAATPATEEKKTAPVTATTTTPAPTPAPAPAPATTTTQDTATTVVPATDDNK